MEDNKVKNFSLAKEEIKFKQDELVFITSFNKTKSMLGLSYGEKINQVHQRQRKFVDNMRKILTLTTKKKYVGKKRKDELDEAIAGFISENKNLLIEVAKFRTTLTLENQSPIKDVDIYEKLVGSKLEDDMEELVKINTLDMIHQEILNQIVLENSELFSNFTGQAFKQSTTNSFISFITPILKHHGFRVNKIKEREETK